MLAWEVVYSLFKHVRLVVRAVTVESNYFILRFLALAREVEAFPCLGPARSFGGFRALSLPFESLPRLRLGPGLAD